MCKCVHFQISVIKTPNKRSIHSMFMERRKERRQWGVGREIMPTGCNYGKGHTSGPPTVSKSESPVGLVKTQMTGTISRVLESTGLGWAWKFTFLTTSRWCWWFWSRYQTLKTTDYTSPCPLILNAYQKKKASDAGISVKFLYSLFRKSSIIKWVDWDLPVGQNHMTKAINEKFKPAVSYHFWKGRKVLWKKWAGVSRSISRLKNHFLSFLWPTKYHTYSIINILHHHPKFVFSG